MLDLTRPVRTKRDHGFSVTILGIHKSREHHERPMLFILTHLPDGVTSVAYRNPDGTHPNGMESYNLVNVDVGDAAHHIQTQIDQPSFTAIRALWLEPFYREVALDGACKGATNVDRRDMRHYLEGLWGR